MRRIKAPKDRLHIYQQSYGDVRRKKDHQNHTKCFVHYNKVGLKDIQFLVWSLVYGVHVSTTVMPIMATFLVSNEVNAKEMCILVSIYAPYLLLPLSLATYSARELLSTRSSTEKKVE